MDEQGPELVLIMSWMNALPQHVSKYAAAYRKLYPTATILHITSSFLEMAFLPQARKRRDLDPVVDIIQAVKEEDMLGAQDFMETHQKIIKREPRIMIHLFSNGGAYATAQLAQAFKQKTKAPLAIDAMVLDSAPGTGSYSRSLLAIMSSMASAPPLIRIVGYVIANFLLAGMWLLQRVGMGDVIARARKDLNDEQLVDRRAPRTYLYSKEDLIVKPNDVETHALDFANKGGEVRLHLFSGSAHASHVKADEEKYWMAVEHAWKKADQL